MAYACDDLSNAAQRRSGVTPGSQGCKECLDSGDAWVHLRLCLSCGHVGCCDSSKNRHATQHHRATKHPVIRSFEPGEEWAYCYAHDAFAEEIPQQPHERAPKHYDAP